MRLLGFRLGRPVAGRPLVVLMKGPVEAYYRGGDVVATVSEARLI